MTFAPLRQTEFWPISDTSPRSSSEVLPARISAQPTPRARASKANEAASTSKPSASSERSALVGSLLRTALISELGALTPCSLRWRASATPAGRLWSVLVTSVPITSGHALGSSGATLSRLPTPTATQYGSQSYPSDPSRKRPSLNTPLATPRKTDGERGGRGDVLSQLRGYPSKHAGMPMMPTPLASDRKGSLGVHGGGGKIKSPNIPSMLSLTPTAKGNLTTPSMLKWAGATALASMLQNHGLTGTAALPITYGWMIGYPPWWLSRALQSAVRGGLLQHPSSSKR